MRDGVRSLPIALFLAITVTGCGSPPNPDVDAARAAVDRAAADRAGQYAAGSLKVAQDARGALDAELKLRKASGLVVRQDQGTRSRCEGGRRQGRGRRGRGQGKGGGCRGQREGRCCDQGEGQDGAAPHRGKIHAPTKIKDVKPVYPAIAQSARVAGAVTIEATIGPDGKS